MQTGRPGLGLWWLFMANCGELWLAMAVVVGHDWLWLAVVGHDWLRLAMVG